MLQTFATRQFKAGNSQAVRIPSEFALEAGKLKEQFPAHQLSAAASWLLAVGLNRWEARDRCRYPT